MRAMWRAVALALACLIATAPAAHAQLITGTALTASGAVTSITGTANQVVASAAVGAVTLSLPQSIATTSIPQFAGLGIGAAGAANQILVPAGAVGTPPYSFSADPTTGFYRSGASQVTLALGGAASYVFSAGNFLSVPSLFNIGGDVVLFRAAANTLQLGTSTSAQALWIANTWTSASVRELLEIKFVSNVARIGTTHVGATARVLTLDYGGTSTAAISIPITSGGIAISGLTVTGAATGKTIVCVDTATGILYASTSGVACAN